ncbi:MAG: OsmC family protein [Desulfovibrionaceae bacterium]|nr:OsmC family protein [Desulfovibrionaceae bacterium]
MSENQVTSVSLVRRGAVVDFETKSQAIPNFHIDNELIPENERGGTAKKLLGSAVLYCYVAALSKALETRAINYERIEAQAQVTAGNDDKGRSRILGINLDVAVHMDADYEDLFERVKKVMRNGCLISASLEAAFPVTYNLTMVCPDD